MIHYYSCYCGSSSTAEIPNPQKVLKFCKLCCSRRSNREREDFSRRMLGTMRMELAGSASSHLFWKKNSKIISKRTPRRPKVFTLSSRCDKISKKSERPNFEDSNKLELSIVESEKLGVTVLGRRFSEPIQNVPIKKRKLFVSSSSAHHSPSVSGDEPGCSFASEHLHTKRKRQIIHSNQGLDKDLSAIAIKENNFETSDKDKLHEGVDFSGISILAAAACDSGDANGFLNFNGSLAGKPGQHLSCVISEKAESHDTLEGKLVEQSSNCAAASEDKVDVPCKILSTSTLSQEEGTSDHCQNFQERINSSCSMPVCSNEALSKNCSSLREEKFHWDLNKAVDEDGNFVDSEHNSVDGNCEHILRTETLSVPKSHSNERVLAQCSSKVSVDVYLTRMEKGSGKLTLSEVSAEQDQSPSCIKNMDHKIEIHDVSSLASDRSADKGTCASAEVAGKLVCAKGSRDNCSTRESISFIAGVACDRSSNELCESSCLKSNAGLKDTPFYQEPSEIYKTEQSPAVGKSTEALLSKGVGHALVVPFPNSQPDGIQSASLNETATSIEHVHNDRGLPIPSGSFIHKVDSLNNDPAEGLCSVRVNVNTVNRTASGIDSGSGSASELVFKSKSLPQSESASTCKSESHHFVPQDVKELNLGSGPVSKEHSVKTNQQEYQSSILIDADVGHETHPVQTELRDSVNCSVDTTVVAAKDFGGITVQDHFECDYDTDSSESNTQEQIELEKSKLNEDDDSQYEDGELRESLVDSWEVDGAEEGEAEHVDYGSDNRETDVFSAPPSCFVSGGSPCFDNVEYKSDIPPEKGHNYHDGGQALEESENPSRTCRSFSTEVGNRTCNANKSVQEHIRGRDGSDNSLKGMHYSKPIATDIKCGTDSGHFLDNNGAKEPTDSISSRMKVSGWDLQPEGTGEGGMGLRCDVKKNQNGVIDKYSADNSCRKVFKSTGKEDLSSRTEGSKFSEISHRKEGAYIWGKRVGSDCSNYTAERGVGRHTPLRREEFSASRHERRSKGLDTWGRSAAQWGPSRHKSPGNYRSSGIGNSSSKNALEAAAAKVESNGFVVAPDGTVIEPCAVEPTVRGSRHNINASTSQAGPHIGRVVSPNKGDDAIGFDRLMDFVSVGDCPDRHGTITRGRSARYDPRRTKTGLQENHNGPVVHDNIDSPYMLSRMDHHSPQRGFLQTPKMHAKSRSRSRTRSPHAWTSPRRKNSTGLNVGPGLRRWSRSPPNFRPGIRSERMRSPNRRPGFVERMPNFVPSSRTHVPLQQNSRWIDERKEFRNQFREQDYRHSSGRSPTRPFSRHRFDIIDDGRMEAEEYHQPVYAGRYREFAIRKRPRGEGHNDRRGHGNRYQMYTSHPSGPYDISDMKHLSYDTDDGFRPNNSHYKDEHEFDERGNSWGFDRDTAIRVNSSPCRSRDDEGQFRYAREARQSGTFRSLRIRECDSDVPRRRHS